MELKRVVYFYLTVKKQKKKYIIFFLSLTACCPRLFFLLLWSEYPQLKETQEDPTTWVQHPEDVISWIKMIPMTPCTEGAMYNVI
jgi:hypothetical protein